MSIPRLVPRPWPGALRSGWNPIIRNHASKSPKGKKKVPRPPADEAGACPWGSIMLRKSIFSTRIADEKGELLHAEVESVRELEILDGIAPIEPNLEIASTKRKLTLRVSAIEEIASCIHKVLETANGSH